MVAEEMIIDYSLHNMEDVYWKLILMLKPHFALFTQFVLNFLTV